MSIRIILCTVVVLASVAAADPILNPDNGHYYDFVVPPLWALTGSYSVVPTWHEALAEAATRTHLGLTGYLATITSAEENAFLFDNFHGSSNGTFAWFAGTDAAVEGEWRWAAGPEAGTQFSQEGTPTGPDFYANWGGIEPNAIAGNHYTMLNLGLTFAGIAGGEWADAASTPTFNDPVIGYFVEFDAGAAAVPEPSTLLLLAVGAIVLLFRRR